MKEIKGSFKKIALKYLDNEKEYAKFNCIIIDEINVNDYIIKNGAKWVCKNIDFNTIDTNYLIYTFKNSDTNE